MTIKKKWPKLAEKFGTKPIQIDNFKDVNEESNIELRFRTKKLIASNGSQSKMLCPIHLYTMMFTPERSIPPVLCWLKTIFSVLSSIIDWQWKGFNRLLLRTFLWTKLSQGIFSLNDWFELLGYWKVLKVWKKYSESKEYFIKCWNKIFVCW